MLPLLLSSICDEIYDHFPLFDENLSHLELCNSVIRHIQYSEIRQNFSNSACSSLFNPCEGHLCVPGGGGGGGGGGRGRNPAGVNRIP